MNLDDLYSRRYSADYTCFEFAADVWRRLAGRDIKEALGLVKSRAVGRLKGCRRLEKPASPCLCILRGVRRVHCGIYIDGGILQLGREGVMWLPEDVLLKLGFYEAKYYALDIH